MVKLYRGVDIAGDRSKRTGVVDLLETTEGPLEVRVPDLEFSGAHGLEQIAKTQENEWAAAGAIDQPLGFPHRTLLLLKGEPVDGVPDADDFRYRRADLSMRGRLRALRLNLDYVRPPVVCDNIWRALQLLSTLNQSVRDSRVGKSSWIETHPRMVVVELVAAFNEDPCLVKDYKTNLKGTSEEERRRRKEISRSARSRLLELAGMKLSLSIASRVRAKLLDDHNTFEALFCAFAAFVKAGRLTMRYAQDELPEEIAATEGYVFVPDWNVIGAGTSGQSLGVDPDGE